MARPARVSPERILAAAAVEFAARGYAGARVDRIAARARVNKAMLYYHFGSKRQLYRELLRSTFAQVAERIRIVGSSDGPPAGMVDAAVETIAEMARQKPFFPAIMLREIAEGGAHLDRGALEALSAVPRAFSGIVARGVAAGAFRPVHPLAAYFTMLAPLVLYMAAAPIRRELSEAHLLDLSALQTDEFIRHLQDSMRRVLARDPSTAPRSKRPTP